MEIIEFNVDKLSDPTGIIIGDRYEYRLYVTLDEEDDLYEAAGTGLRVLLAVDGEEERIASYHFFDRSTEKVQDFELEDDEKALILEFCKSNRPI